MKPTDRKKLNINNDFASCINNSQYTYWYTNRHKTNRDAVFAQFIDIGTAVLVISAVAFRLVCVATN